ncbi:MAG: Transcriptional regulator, MarR family [Hydrocarboniphaga sp.]|uniref:MarR family winged helix-turn-helix transcriptional regulator n=1 Tax=Hydrocarboniphaga sp. TaxID=2033016 RepID=UPI00261FA3DC|nr:MarR family transcriptional regulator [Hydrocarboniphaga sp.]MDB5973036.1 Transcriptional regulator, MarR family [Hydrocarboniphaga sp.]
MDRSRIFGFLVKDVARLSSKNFERLASGLNLTLAQCKVLHGIERSEGLSQVKLAELADTDPMALVRILDRMERDGWVERRADPADRRARQLFLTAAAAPVIAEMWQIADQSRAQALAGLSEEQRAQLLDLLLHVQRNLSQLVPTTADDACAPPASEAAAPATTPDAAQNPRAARRKPT